MIGPCIFSAAGRARVCCGRLSLGDGHMMTDNKQPSPWQRDSYYDGPLPAPHQPIDPWELATRVKRDARLLRRMVEDTEREHAAVRSWRRMLITCIAFCTMAGLVNVAVAIRTLLR